MPLIGREAELAALDDAVSMVKGGRRVLVTISGDEGSGIGRLARRSRPAGGRPRGCRCRERKLLRYREAVPVRWSARSLDRTVTATQSSWRAPSGQTRPRWGPCAAGSSNGEGAPLLLVLGHQPVDGPGGQADGTSGGGVRCSRLGHRSQGGQDHQGRLGSLGGTGFGGAAVRAFRRLPVRTSASLGDASTGRLCVVDGWIRATGVGASPMSSLRRSLRRSLLWIGDHAGWSRRPRWRLPPSACRGSRPPRYLRGGRPRRGRGARLGRLSRRIGGRGGGERRPSVRSSHGAFWRPSAGHPVRRARRRFRSRRTWIG